MATRTGSLISPSPVPLVVTFTGRFDAVEALTRHDDLLDLPGRARANGADAVRVDLTAVTFLDSAALAALVRLRRECHAHGVALVLVRPTAPDALRIFRLTQLDCVFTMLDAEDPA